MAALSSVLFCFMLVVSTVAQQDAVRAASGGSKTLQPWLLGLTAMVVFLFIVFVLMIINRVWCKKEKNEFKEEAARMERAEMNVYDNNAMEEEEEEKEKENKVKEQKNKAEDKLEEKKEEQKITAM